MAAGTSRSLSRASVLELVLISTLTKIYVIETILGMKRYGSSVLVLSFLLTACGGGGGPTPTGDGGTDVPPVMDCVPDPALVAARKSCRADDTCPCGTHCSYGLCEATCTGDAECTEGQRCDRFGRCRGVDETALVPLPKASTTEGELSANFAQEELDPATGEGVISINVAEEAAARVRVAAQEGSEIKCSDGTWNSECDFMNVEPDVDMEIEVRIMDAPTTGEEMRGSAIDIYTEDGHEAVGIERPADVPEPSVPFETTPFDGVYEGNAELTGAGFGDATSAGDSTGGPIELFVRANLYGDASAATLEIDDPYGAFTSAKKLIGTVVLTDMDADGTFEGDAVFPVQPYYEGSFGTALPYDALAHFISAKVTLQDEPRIVRIEMIQSFSGVGPNVTPTVGWSLALGRTDDQTGTAPAVPVDAPPVNDAAVAVSTPTPWEAAMATPMGDFAALTRTEQFDRFSFIHREPSLQSCFDDIDQTGGIAGLVGLGMSEFLGGSFNTGNGGPGGPPADSLALRKDAVGIAIFNTFEKNPTIDSIQKIRVDSVGNATYMFPAGRDFEPGKIPCSGNFYSAPIPGLGHFGKPGQERWFYTCQELAKTTGCLIHSINTNVRETSRFIYYDVEYVESGVAKSGIIQSQIGVRWFEECTLPTYPNHCVNGIACSEPVDSEVTTSVPAVAFSSELSGNTRDLKCASGARTAAVDLDRRIDEGGANAPNAEDAFEKCIADFDALLAAPPTPMGKYGAGLVDVFRDSTCLDPGRFLTALEMGLRNAQLTHPYVPTLQYTNDKSKTAGAYAAYLLSRWLQMHAFLASEGIQRQQMAAVFEGTGTHETPDLGRVLTDSMAAWDLVLHPRFFDAIAALHPDVLGQPDYRQFEHTVGARLSDSQRNGLPAVMLDSLARQSELLKLLVEVGAFNAGATVDDHLAEVVPRTILVRALAGGLMRKTLDGVPEGFDWEERFVVADTRLASAWSGAQTVAAAINEGLNPLGIEDEDLPLYFLADSADGPGGRFGAISDFILGSGPASSAWAPALVSQAADALEDARSSYIAQADREYLVARDQRDHERWVGEVRDDYNAQLRDYCGPVEESLIDDPNFHSSGCFINRARASCRVTDKYWSRWRERDLLGRACYATSLAGFADNVEEVWFDSCFTGLPRDATRGADVLKKEACSSGVCLSCVAKPEIGQLALNSGSLNIKLPRFRSKIARNRALQRTKIKCKRRYRGMRLNIPVPKPNPLDQPECVRGTLGEHQLDVVAATNAVTLARTSMSEFTEAYNIAIDGCVILETDATARKALRDSHNANMEGLRTARAIADSVAVAAAGVKDCAATVAGSDKSNPVSAIASSAGIAGACVAAGVEAAAAITSIGIDTGIENAEASHDAAVANLDEQSEIRLCYNDARLELVGLRSAKLELKQAAFDLRRAQATVEQEILDAQRIWADGHAYLAEIEGFPVRPPSGDLWVDERVNTYVRRFKLARRAAYLAVRAVEYEYQQSLGQRAAVLAAETPDDLEVVLQDLWTASGTRTIKGSRPSDLHVVLSLRDDIMRLADESNRPSELGPLSPAQRFRLELSSPTNAVYDADGRWLGQRIPFDLAPLGAYGLDTAGVPIYSTGDCAERLWSVNASVLGADVLEGTDTTFIRMDLHKENTFFSQWCGTAPPDDPFQAASVRPTRNLFREPGVGASVGESFGVEQSLGGTSRARIQAFLNVDRATFEDPTYANGETSELAARGLFGRYAIFIPAELIAEESSSGGYTTGLVFDRVDDILLRLDYVSVAE